MFTPDIPDYSELESENLLDYLGEYWQMSKYLTAAFGTTYAVWITFMIDHRRFLIRHNMIKKGDLFYCDQSLVEKWTKLHPNRQTRIIKKLSELGIIDVERCGVPPRNYYKINIKFLVNLSTFIVEINHKIHEETGTQSHIFKTCNINELYVLISRSCKTMDLDLCSVSKSCKTMDLKTLFYRLYINKNRSEKEYNLSSKDERETENGLNKLEGSLDTAKPKLKKRSKKMLLIPKMNIPEEEEKKQEPKPKTRTNPLSGAIKEIVYHWNNSPGVRNLQLVKNGSKPSKTYNKVIKVILPKLLNGTWTISKIKKSITTYSNMLNNNVDYLLMAVLPGHRPSFEEFLSGFGKNTKIAINDNNVVSSNLIWLKECKKPQKYLDRMYGRKIKSDENLYKEFLHRIMHPYDDTPAGISTYIDPTEWSELQFDEMEQISKNGVLSIHEENTIRNASNHLLEFMKVYKMGTKVCPIKRIPNDPNMMVMVLFRAISESIGRSSNFKISFSWLGSVKTYEERIPKMLKFRDNLPKEFVPYEMPWKDYRKGHGNGNGNGS